MSLAPLSQTTLRGQAKHRGLTWEHRHHVNVAPIFVTLNKQDWISTEHKVQLLEWKIRMDIVQYVARGCPKLAVDKIANYVPKDKDPKPATGEPAPYTPGKESPRTR